MTVLVILTIIISWLAGYAICAEKEKEEKKEAARTIFRLQEKIKDLEEEGLVIQVIYIGSLRTHQEKQIVSSQMMSLTMLRKA